MKIIFEKEYMTHPDTGSVRYLGSVLSDQNPDGRPTGSDGWREELLTETTEMVKGHRTVKVSVKPGKPIHVRTMVFPLSLGR